MKNEISCSAVIFRREGGDVLYLLLDCRSRYDLVKGNMISGESEKETALREIEEETGITDVEFVDDFRESFSYRYRWDNELINKKVVIFLAETKTRSITISFEHFGYKWCDFDEAVRLLKFKNTRDILKKANDILIAKLK